MRHIREARVILDSLGFDLEGRGQIAVRIAKATFNENGTLAERGRPHRLVLHPGDDIDAVVEAIGDHLENTLGYDRLSDRDVARLKAHSMIEWTPDVIEAHLQRWIEWERENEAHCRDKGLPALTLNVARMIDFHQRLAPAFLTEDEIDDRHQNLTH